jgi:adenylate cyclase class 2
MKIEYEATFYPIDKQAIREKLKAVRAKLERIEYLQKRVVFNLPEGHEIPGGWLRVRNEDDRITMSLKVVDGERIENQKEICLKVDSFDQAELFLKTLGCERKAYQETKRELWKIDEVEICIDEWPWLEPFVEIEGQSEEEVREVSELLGFDYAQAKFGSVDMLYALKYDISNDVFNNQSSLVLFEGENPFAKYLK